MTYQVLARKWRPRDFTQMTGQAHVVRALVNALDNDRVHHAFLFTGTRGVGKTTLARILAKCLNCEQGVSSTPCGECSACGEIDEGRFVDLIEVDAASRAKVDETRELMENVQFTPTRGRYKVYLIDEVHMFSNHSFNALLKTLEEPPPHVKFLLATTDPQKLPVTVLSRCLQFNLKRLPTIDIADSLTSILANEDIEAEPNAVRLIAQAADGSMRDALSLLDQAIAYGGGRVERAEVQDMLGTVDAGHVRALLEALAGGDAPAVMRCIEAMAADVTDFGEALGKLLTELQRIAVAQLVPEALDDAADDKDAVLALAQQLSPEDAQLYYQIGLLGRRDLALAPDLRGGFEMLMLRMLAFRPAGVGTSGESVRSASAPARRPADVGAAKAVPPAGAGPVSTPAPERVSTRQAAPEAPHEPAATERPISEVTTRNPLTRESWSDVVATLNLTGMTRELAANSVFKERDGNLIRLQIAPTHAQLTGRKVDEKLRAALEAYCGGPVRLDFELETPDSDSPAQRQQRHAQERQQAAAQALEQDPNVRAICDTFGASIDPGSIRPLD